MSRSPRWSRAVFSAATALAPAPLFASPYTDVVETAVFDLCPGLRGGLISAEHPAELLRQGWRRRSEMEEDWADVEDGAPFIFSTGTGAAEVILAYWRDPQGCHVSFGGPRAASAMARVRARMAREPDVFRRDVAADYRVGALHVEAWRVVRRLPVRMWVEVGEGDPSGRHDIRYGPLG